MRIGLVATTFWPILGGMEIYLRQLAGHLAARSHEVRVVTRFTEHRPPDMKSLLSSRQRPASYASESYRVHVMDPGILRSFLMKPAYRLHFYGLTQRLAADAFSIAFRKELRRHLDGCSVVHFSGTGRELLGFSCADHARHNRIPFVVTPHVHANAWGDGEIDLDLYRRADAVVALTQVEKKHLVSKGLNPERVVVQGHGVNVEGNGNGAAFRAKHDIEGPMVLYMGRKNRYKGYERLLVAAPAVWKHVPDAVFVVAGPDDPAFNPGDHVRDVARDHRIVEVGPIDEKAREDILDACDVFCLPSEAEAFGLAYLEAGFYGKAVVALDIPTLRELIGAAGSGVLLSDDPAELAQSLVDLLKSPERRARFGAAGRSAAQRATWSEAAQSMESLYARLEERKRAALQSGADPSRRH